MSREQFFVLAARRVWRSTWGVRSAIVPFSVRPDRDDMLPVFDEVAGLWKIVPAARLSIGHPLPSPKPGARRWESPQAWQGERWWNETIILRHAAVGAL